MSLPGTQGPIWKLQRATASIYAPLRGVLLILNLLLYAICPVSAVAALPRDPPRGQPYYESTTVGSPKWHTGFFSNSSFTNSSIANSSLSTWASTFTSGSRLVTLFSVHTAQGHPSSSEIHRIPFASHGPQNISALPLTANVTHRRDSTTPISPSLSRYLRPGHHEATTTGHRTNSTSRSTPSIKSPTRVYQEANSSHHSTSNASPPASLSRNTTRAYHAIATDLSLANRSSISSLPSWSSSGPRSLTPSSHSFSLHGNITRAHGNITAAGISFTKTSSMPAGVSPTPLSPLPSRLQSFTSPPSPLYTSNLIPVSGPSSIPTKARYAVPPASSSTNPSRSSLASITPKPSTTPTPFVISDPSSSANNLTFSLPPGCKVSTFYDETFILIPTDRARMAYPHTTALSGPSDSTVPQTPGPSSSTTSQAGAAGYPHTMPQKPPPTDQNPAPSKRTMEIALGICLGLFPTYLALPIAMLDFHNWRAARDRKEGRVRKIPKYDPAEEMLAILEDVTELKWNQRLATFLEDFRGWSRKTGETDFPTITEKQKKKDKRFTDRMNKLLKINAYQGPKFKDEVRRLKDPTERDRDSCNYKNPAEMTGCLDPPEDWPKTEEEGPPRLTHEAAMAMSEQLHPPTKSAKFMNGKLLKILKVPEGYERLTLDSKLAYLKTWTKMTVADPRLRFFDGRCAAVGPGNSPLGGQDVDKLWLDDDLNLTMEGTKVEPDSEVGEMYEMVQKYETARFVRQNFPTVRFEGVERGSPYDRDPPVEGDQGRPRGKAKVLTVEQLRQGLSFPERQAMDMQMDHDLEGTPENTIINWYNNNYPNLPSQSTITQNMRMLYWSQSPGVAPNVGDFTEWGSRLAQPPPQDIELPNAPDSPNPPNAPDSPNPPNAPDSPNSPDAPNTEPPNSPDSDDSDRTIRPSDFQTSNAEELAQQLEKQVQQAKEQLRRAEQQLRDEAKAREAENREIREEQARQKVDEQMREVDQANHEEAKARAEEARVQRHNARIEEIQEDLRNSNQRMRADQELSEAAVERLQEAQEWSQRIKDWQKQVQEEASQRAKEANDGKKPSRGRGHNREPANGGRV